MSLKGREEFIEENGGYPRLVYLLGVVNNFVSVNHDKILN
jgi:hypothetical protein